MCGIAGFHIKDQKVVKDHGGIETLVDELLLGIEQRGKHATGFVAVTVDGKTQMDKSATSATEFIKDRERIPEGVQTVLLHTRYATQGPKEVHGNNHPVISKTCFAIHNGQIQNDDELFKDEKVKRNFEVDSEIIPALLAKYGMKNLDSVKKALTKFQGSMAIAAIDPVKAQGKLLLAKGDSSPLVVYESDSFLMWASLSTAMRDAWAKVLGTPPAHNKFTYLQPGDIVFLDGDETIRGRYDVNHPIYQSRWQGRGHTPIWERPAILGPTTPTTRTRSGSRTGNGSWDTNKSPFATEAEHKLAVSNYRKDQVSNARLWSNREEYPDDWFNDVPEGENLTWIPCKCGESVLSQDMRQHLKYGYVCVDCYAVIRDEYAKKVGSGNSNGPVALTSGGTGHGSEDDTSTVYQLTEQDKKNIENWADVEQHTHRLILNAVALASGYSKAACDFLIFRSGAAAADFGKGTRTLKADLQRLYEELTPKIWENFGMQLLEGNGEELDLTSDTDGDHHDIPGGSMMYVPFKVSKKGGISEDWFRCTEHGEAFRLGDECGPCTHQDEISREGSLGVLNAGRAPVNKYTCDDCGEEFPRWQITKLSPENYMLCDECKSRSIDGASCGVEPFTQEPEATSITDIGRCPTCKAFVKENTPCVVCKAKGLEMCDGIENISSKCPGCWICGFRVNTKELSIVDTAKIKTCSGAVARGTCRKKVRWVVGTTSGYCDSHFGICNRARCKAKANHTLPSGERVCHAHSRGCPGAKADTALMREGHIITEVKA